MDSYITYLLCLNKINSKYQTYITNIKIYTYLNIFECNVFDNDSLRKLLTISTKEIINEILNKFLKYNNMQGIIFILKNIDLDIAIDVINAAHHIIALNNNEILKLLLDKSFILHLYHVMGPLITYAIKDKHNKSAKFLIKYLDPKFVNINFYFMVATQCGNIKIIKLLLKFANDISIINLHFIEACYAQHIDIIKYFIANDKVDPSYDNNAALLSACINNNKELAELLLCDSRVNPLDRNYEIILIAIEEEHIDIAKLLIERSTLVINHDLINYFAENGETLMVNLLKTML